MPSRSTIVALARGWLGTPYCHQASARGVGTDCIGLVRGVFRDLYGCEPEPLPGYSRDWAEATGTETLLEAARRHLVEIAPAAARPGDVLVFRLRPRLPAKHAGIVGAAVLAPADPLAATPGPALIHALEGVPVAEVTLSPWWQRRIAAAFSFPGASD